MLKVLTTWDLEPSIIIGCLVLQVWYVILARGTKTSGWRIASFSAGTLIFLLALISPLDVVGDYYLFSAHMVQHLLIILATPPLWIWGLSPELIKRIRTLPVVPKAERVLAKPLVAWLVGVITLWVWHIPALFNATLQSEPLHIGEHLLFLASSLVFWWPLIVPAPVGQKAMQPLIGVLYLFLGAASSSILGIILTFAPAGFYEYYLHSVDVKGLLSIFRQDWGISTASDQQIGGLIMWVVGSPVYLIGCFWLLGRWFSESEREATKEAMLEAEKWEQQYRQQIDSQRVVENSNNGPSSSSEAKRVGGSI